jgi:hypothetical protein
MTERNNREIENRMGTDKGGFTMTADGMENRIFCGDSRDILKTFPDNSADCCVTSKPPRNGNAGAPAPHAGNTAAA